MAGRKDDGRLRCSFCGKPQDAVRKLIAGPGNGVYICDECIGVCSEIVNEEMDSQDIAENNFDGIIKEKSHLLHSTKRKGLGIGTQSVRRMAEKNDGSCNFTYENGVFTAKIMLRATL